MYQKIISGNIQKVRFMTTAITAQNKPTEELKLTFKARLIKYWQNLYKDYSEVFKDIVTDAKDRPLRAVSILWGFGIIYLSAVTNPDEKHYLESVRKYNNDLILVSEQLQNPRAVDHLKHIETSLNTGLLRRLNLGILSIMWTDDYDQDCKLYKCTCPYLKPHYKSFFDRVVDIGFCDKWFILDRKMVDYDINY